MRIKSKVTSNFIKHILLLTIYVCFLTPSCLKTQNKKNEESLSVLNHKMLDSLVLHDADALEDSLRQGAEFSYLFADDRLFDLGDNENTQPSQILNNALKTADINLLEILFRYAPTASLRYLLLLRVTSEVKDEALLLELVNRRIITKSLINYSHGKAIIRVTCVAGANNKLDFFSKIIFLTDNPYGICQYTGTELSYAIITGNVDAIRHVLTSGYLKHIGLNYEKEKAEVLNKKILVEDGIYLSYPTPIQIAIEGGMLLAPGYYSGVYPNIEIIKLLVSLGADIQAWHKKQNLVEIVKKSKRPKESKEKVLKYLKSINIE